MSFVCSGLKTSNITFGWISADSAEISLPRKMPDRDGKSHKAFSLAQYKKKMKRPTTNAGGLKSGDRIICELKPMPEGGSVFKLVKVNNDVVYDINDMISLKKTDEVVDQCPGEFIFSVKGEVHITELVLGV